MKGKGMLFVPADGRSTEVVVVKRDKSVPVKCISTLDELREDFLREMRERGAVAQE